MSEQRWSDVDRYLADQLIGPDPELDAATQAAAAAGLPPIAVSPSQGKLLHLLARSIGARTILEVGTLGGYSTIWLARALPEGGRLVTLEADPGYAEVASSSIERAGLGALVQVRVGPALETLPPLAAEGGSRSTSCSSTPTSATRPTTSPGRSSSLAPGSLIIADNVIRDGAVIDADSEDSTVLGSRRFHELLAREPRVSATTIQTVGLKGYDGFTLALVNDR